MNLEGYESSGESSDENLPVSGSVSERAPAFVAASTAQKPTFGGVYQKAIAIPVVRAKRSCKARNSKHKRRKNDDPESLEYKGSWASSDSSDGAGDCHAESEEEEGEEEDPEESQKVEEKKVTTESYAQRDFMKPTRREGQPDVPEKLKFTFDGHPKGVTRLRFLPKSGHLLLSCGNDGKIFLWELGSVSVAKVRGYFGHSQAVKDVVFSADGKTFLSCSYDNTVILWDTCTGEILKTLRLAAFPNCALFNPLNKGEFVVGLENHNIVHYDLNALDSPLQVYDHHLGAINSLTAINSEGVFMSTSEDRTVRFWKWNINIPTKIIADATQHAVPSAAVHPKDKYIALQSMEDSVHVVNVGGKYRFNKGKTFSGHKVAGYGIEVGFSCDGESLVSGDAKGDILVWSWKTCRVTKRIKLGEMAITCVATHPSRPEVIAAAGRKGEIHICNLQY